MIMLGYQMAQNMIEQRNQYTLALEQVKSQAMVAAQSQAPQRSNALSEAISELESDFNSMDENDAIEKIKNWQTTASLPAK